jgi:hypothetical protein
VGRSGDRGALAAALLGPAAAAARARPVRAFTGFRPVAMIER